MRAVVGRVVVVDLVALQREVELGHVEVDEEAWLGSGLGLGLGFGSGLGLGLGLGLRLG